MKNFLHIFLYVVFPIVAIMAVMNIVYDYDFGNLGDWYMLLLIYFLCFFALFHLIFLIELWLESFIENKIKKYYGKRIDIDIETLEKKFNILHEMTKNNGQNINAVRDMYIKSDSKIIDVFDEAHNDNPPSESIANSKSNNKSS